MGFGGSNSAASEARAEEARRQQAIRTGVTNIDTALSGFDEGFYKKRAQAYLDYAMPQYAQQYRQTRNASIYDLANRGLLKSSTAQNRGNLLESEKNYRLQGLVNTGNEQANQLRRDVTNERANLIQQLTASQDPSLAYTSALATANAYRAPSVYKPLGSLFGQFANTYLARQMTQSPQMTYTSPNFNLNPQERVSYGY